MNSFAHVLPWLDRDSNYVIGCVVPDWLGAIDRRCRVRRKGASRLVSDDDPQVANLAGGIIQHLDDDHWFHAGRQFTDLALQFAVELRQLLRDEPGFRPGFLGHIMIEMLLDGFLHEGFPGKLDQFYDIVGRTDPMTIQSSVNEMAAQPTDRLSTFFSVFLRERFLYDYVDDAWLMHRVNQVLRRVKLVPVGNEIFHWLPSARARVYRSASDLLSGSEIDFAALPEKQQ